MYKESFIDGNVLFTLECLQSSRGSGIGKKAKFIPHYLRALWEFIIKLFTFLSKRLEIHLCCVLFFFSSFFTSLVASASQSAFYIFLLV